ncbi:MAG: hypothetical protein Q7I99_02885 [Acholeplasmataceae bacterium]|nr:hypothetical protein [Acholeplasmataceae bacterium]
MRKYDVFGKKISQAKFLYIIFFVFLVVIGGYFGVIRLQQSRLDALKDEERSIQRQINLLLQSGQTVNYYTIDELIPYLPSSFDQQSIANTLEYVRNISGLANSIDYHITYNPLATSPFTDPLPASIKFVSLTISMQIEEPLLILDYIENLYAEDLIFYIRQVNVAYTIDGTALIQMQVFTFYNDVNP